MIVHSDSYILAQRTAIDLRGVPQIPDEIAEKLARIERYKAINLSSNDYKRIRKTIVAACIEIRKRRMELMGAVEEEEREMEEAADY